ncbi:MAG: hypothetical protein M0R73_02245 [Dehalococcoidia bacterium]|nr:hypothetical protein [Dehalococcoidia bacterium]
MAIQPEIDNWVLTSDGRPVGRIKRITDGAFLLDVPGEPDYWLRTDEVASIGDETVRAVRMQFDADALDEHRIKYGE